LPPGRAAFARPEVRVPLSAPRRTWAFAALLASLSMLGPFSVDMYLPALPAIAGDLGVPPIAVQQTLSAYLFAFAAMMLWHGALADAFGRRPVMLAALGIYAVATLGCAIAGNIESLWLFRALQGMSSGAGLVVGRAIMRDAFASEEAQRLMAQTTLVFGLAPALAPVLGGLLLDLWGWRAIFWTLLALVLGVAAWTAARLPETVPAHARQPLRPRVLWRNYRALATRLDFLLLALIPALNFAGFFLYIASAPAFLIDRLGVSTRGFAWLFVPMIAGMMLGAVVSGRLAGRRSAHLTIRLGYAIMFAGVALNLGICWTVAPGVPWNVLPIMVYAMGASIVMPSVTLLLLDLFPGVRGLASSLQSFVNFALSALNAGSLAPLLAQSTRALALGMAACALASLALWLLYRNRAGASPPGGAL
jgi:DHA1 family bicyclomycin/chloramphenicol resistance-like MFS transporter